jgi:NTE family protein
VAGSALVLGGGGVTGIAWELGLLAGLADGGVDLSGADLIVGTSAGSVVGALIATVDSLEELYEGQTAAVGAEVTARMGLGLLLRLAAATLSTRDERKALTRIGAVALAADTMSESDRRAVISSGLPIQEWPDRRLMVTAVAADNGEFVTFDRESGVSLVDAVAASCAVPGVWPPVTIRRRRYIDGGMRSPVNADLAEGYDRVIALAPINTSFRSGQSAAGQLARLPQGTRTLLIGPDQPARAAIGNNMLDPQRRGPAAQAGRRQADDVRADVAKIWSV